MGLAVDKVAEGLQDLHVGDGVPQLRLPSRGPARRGIIGTRGTTPGEGGGGGGVEWEHSYSAARV